MTIVIAWVTMDGTRHTGRYRDRYQLEPILNAVVWLNDGNESDVERARLHKPERAIRSQVYTFQTSEPNPLELARSLISS